MEELLLPLRSILLISAVVINFFLGFFVYKNNPKSATNKLYVLLSVAITLWLIVTYLSLHQSFISMSLFLIRMSILFATPMTMLFFLLAHTIPHETIQLKREILYSTLIVTAVTMLTTVSPYTFTGVEIRHSSPIPSTGPVIALFAAVSTAFSFLAVFFLIKKLRHLLGAEKQQVRLMMIGILIMLVLVILAVLIPVLFFETNFGVAFIPVYTLIFLGLTAYAIVKHHLFDIKVVTTEALVAIIWVVLLSKTFLSVSFADAILNSFILLAMIVFGVFLVRSVIKEIEQRQQVEKLSAELFRANQKLTELDKLKTEFLSITSHQLRTPLSGIKGYMSMMLDGDFGKFSEEQVPIMTRVAAEVDRLVRLVQDFLNVSRIESGKLVINRLDFDLVSLVKTVIKELEPAAFTRGLHLSYASDMAKLSAKGDPDKLKDVLVNLTDNAIKYTEKGKVWIEVKEIEAAGVSSQIDPANQINDARQQPVSDALRPAGQTATAVDQPAKISKWAQVEVHDSGVGVDPAEITKLFNKFQRAAGIAKVSPSGTGLGLYTAKKIITAHGGEIWAESQGKGQGSVFAFKIPVG